MYVKIGNYPSGIYWFHKLGAFWLEKTHKKFSWEVDDPDYTWLDKVVLAVTDALQYALDVTIGRWASNRERKVVVRIDKQDIWSADHTLSLIIVPLLKRLQETKHGSPLIDDEDVPDELKSTSAPPRKNEWDTDDNYHKRWDYVLGEMIWAMERVADENLWYTGTAEDRARQIKGLLLFGKYFLSLWS